MSQARSNTFYIPSTAHTPDKPVETLALLDSGAGNNFIDSRLVDQWKLIKKPLDKPITVKNADGTENERGKITHFTEFDITIYGRTTKIKPQITGLGRP